MSGRASIGNPALDQEVPAPSPVGVGTACSASQTVAWAVIRGSSRPPIPKRWNTLGDLVFSFLKKFEDVDNCMENWCQTPSPIFFGGEENWNISKKPMNNCAWKQILDLAFRIIAIMFAGYLPNVGILLLIWLYVGQAGWLSYGLHTIRFSLCAAPLPQSAVSLTPQCRTVGCSALEHGPFFLNLWKRVFARGLKMLCIQIKSFFFPFFWMSYFFVWTQWAEYECLPSSKTDFVVFIRILDWCLFLLRHFAWPKDPSYASELLASLHLYTSLLFWEKGSVPSLYHSGAHCGQNGAAPEHLWGRCSGRHPAEQRGGTAAAKQRWPAVYTWTNGTCDARQWQYPFPRLWWPARQRYLGGRGWFRTPSSP